MNIITHTFRKHIGIIRNYPLAAIITLFSFAVTIWYGISIHKPLRGIGYIFAMWLAAFVTDALTDAFPKTTIGFPIKKPVKNELFTILICTALGCLFLFIRFRCGWEHMNQWLRLAFIPLILFTMPVVLAVIYLFRYQYKPKELGANIHYWYLALPIHLIVGGTTLLIAPELSHWKEAFAQMSIPGLLFTGLISAALPEEFIRMLLQTRLGKACNNVGLGFVTATFIWAAMHFFTESKNEITIDWGSHAIRTITLLPVGFMWGYITHRTKSLLPAVLVHGFNLWGLQNIMG